jgi:IS5 family transposase
MPYFVGLPSFQLISIFDHSLLSIFRERLGKQGGEQLNKIIVAQVFESSQIQHRKSRTANEENKKSNEGQEVNDQQNNDIDKKDTVTPVADEQDSTIKNRGTVKMDATVVPQNITYPTDTKLLNHSRELSEAIIDVLNYEKDGRLSLELTVKKLERSGYCFQKIEGLIKNYCEKLSGRSWVILTGISNISIRYSGYSNKKARA